MTKNILRESITVISIVIIIFVLGCSNNSQPTDTYSISGKITFYNSDGTPADSMVIGTVRLYNPATFCDSIADIQNEYPMVGPDMNPILYTDYRVDSLAGSPIAESETNTNGDFEIKNLPSRNYLLVYLAPGYGWHQQVCKVPNDSLLNLKMRNTIEVTGDLVEDTVWGPDQHIKIGSIGSDFAIFAILDGVNLEIAENTVIEIVDAEILVIGSIDVNGTEAEPVIFTSGSDAPAKEDWDGIEIGTSNDVPSFSNCIVEWGSYGIRNNTNGNINVDDISVLFNLTEGFRFEESTGNINSSLFYDCKIGINFQTTYEIDTQSLIKNCIVMKNSEYGIYLYASSPNIENSVFLENQYHILCGALGGHSHTGTNPPIKHCLFKSSSYYAILSNRTGPTITKCEFINNQNCIRCYNTFNTTVNYNNFYNTTKYVFKLSYRNGVSEVDATHNWWNTINPDEIQDFIWDENDEPGGDDVGIVDYSNWLYSPVPDAGPQPR